MDTLCCNLWLEILLHLDEVDVERLRTTCHMLESVGRMERLWKILYLRRFRSTPGSTGLWKEQFRLKHILKKAWLHGTFEYVHDPKILAHEAGVTCVCVLSPTATTRDGVL